MHNENKYASVIRDNRYLTLFIVSGKKPCLMQEHRRHSACFELLFVTIGLNYEESNDDIHETAAMLDAILNFSKCSRVTKVHPADSENRPPGLPKTVKKKTYSDISRFSENMPLGSRTNQHLVCDLSIL